MLPSSQEPMPGPYLLISPFLPISLSRQLLRKVCSLYVSAITALVHPLVDSYLDYRKSPWIDFLVSWLSFPGGTCFHCHQSNLYKTTLDFAILSLKASSCWLLRASNLRFKCLSFMHTRSFMICPLPNTLTFSLRSYRPFSNQIWIF